jgi:hypothetical protein
MLADIIKMIVSGMRWARHVTCTRKKENEYKVQVRHSLEHLRIEGRLMSNFTRGRGVMEHCEAFVKMVWG